MVKEEALVLIAAVLTFILSDSTSHRGFIGMVFDDNELRKTEKEIPPMLQKEIFVDLPVKGEAEFNVDAGRKNELIHGRPVLSAGGCGNAVKGSGCGSGCGNMVKGSNCGGCSGGCSNMVKGGRCGGCGGGCGGGECGNRVKSGSCGGCGGGCGNLVSCTSYGGCGASPARSIGARSVNLHAE